MDEERPVVTPGVTRQHRLTCEWDGHPFTSTRSDARYCSTRCRVAAHRQRQEAPPRAEAPLDVSIDLTALAQEIAFRTAEYDHLWPVQGRLIALGHALWKEAEKWRTADPGPAANEFDDLDDDLPVNVFFRRHENATNENGSD